VIRGRGTYEGKQALTYVSGIAAETTGSQGICMHLLNIPPKERAKAHLHENHETAIYVISGQSIMWYGERLEEREDINSGDFIYIPAGVPHRFFDFDESFQAWVMFYGPKGGEDLMRSPPGGSSS